MKLYVYLEHEEFIENWVNGGVIPIKPVSHYFGVERNKEITPDETKYVRADKDFTTKKLDVLKRLIDFGDNTHAVFSDVAIEDSENKFTINSLELKRIHGWVLCFSTIKCSKIAEKFERKYCVEISDIRILKKYLDKQFSQTSIIGKCKYINGLDRDHFTKGKADSWQREYRLLWESETPYIHPKKIKFPKGIAKRVNLKNH